MAQLVTKHHVGEEVKELTASETTEYLKQFVNKVITVFISQNEDRRAFDLCISVEGTLEHHSEKPNDFRVLVNDNTYCYFDSYSIVRIANKLPAKYVNSEIVIKLQNI